MLGEGRVEEGGGLASRYHSSPSGTHTLAHPGASVIPVRSLSPAMDVTTVSSWARLVRVGLLSLLLLCHSGTHAKAPAPLSRDAGAGSL